MKKMIGLILLLTSWSAFSAMDPAAKEDLTPPPPEGAISPQQLPPIATITTPRLPTPSTTNSTLGTPSSLMNANPQPGANIPSSKNPEQTVVPAKPIPASLRDHPEQLLDMPGPAGSSQMVTRTPRNQSNVFSQPESDEDIPDSEIMN